jgi:hypothetical protein
MQELKLHGFLSKLHCKKNYLILLTKQNHSFFISGILLYPRDTEVRDFNKWSGLFANSFILYPFSFFLFPFSFYLYTFVFYL